MDILETEALAWLEQTDDKVRNVGDSSDNLTPEDTLRLVKELYAAGAECVLAYRIEVDEYDESGDSLKIILPKETSKREALFAFQKRVLTETGSPYDPESEQGQEFFYIGW
jgi:hypothetical protein